MTKYQIEGCDGVSFRCLRAAKHYIYHNFNQEKRIIFDGKNILRVENEQVVTITPIIVTTDGYSFGKTKKI